MQIGVAGLGRMGAAIATRLLEVGRTLTVWNRSPEKAKPLESAGAALARSPAELAAQAEGIYAIVRHGNHTHLAYVIELPQRPGSKATSTRSFCRK